MNCSLPASSVHGISQATILEQVAMPLSRGTSQPRDEPTSLVSCIGRWVLYHQRHLGSPGGITAELVQILKDDAVKVLYLICQEIWKTQQWPQDWKRLVFIPIPKNGNAKECSNYLAFALISHARKVIFKVLQHRLQQYVNQEIPDVQAGFRIGKGTRNQIANICWIIQKAQEFQKDTCFFFID